MGIANPPTSTGEIALKGLGRDQFTEQADA